VKIGESARSGLPKSRPDLVDLKGWPENGRGDQEAVSFQLGPMNGVRLGKQNDAACLDDFVKHGEFHSFNFGTEVPEYF